MNITTLTEIEFGFDNVEVITMPAQFLKTIGISDIRRCVFGGAVDNGLRVMRRLKADRIRISIDRAVENESLKSFGFAHDTLTGAQLFKRIGQFNDIVDLTLTYDDGTSECIAVPWEDGTKGGEENIFQRSHIANDGSLVIEIGKDFSKEEQSELIGL